MILSSTIANKASILAETYDNLLPLFPPLERAVIIALKKMNNEKNCAVFQTAQSGERYDAGNTHVHREPQIS